MFLLQSQLEIKSSKKTLIFMIPQQTHLSYNSSHMQLPIAAFLSFPPHLSSINLAFLPFPRKTQKNETKTSTDQNKQQIEEEMNVGTVSQFKESQLMTGKVQDLKKKFKKDIRCPVSKCAKKYSSRIALRAHVRKAHPGWYEQTSDYEP